MELEKQSMTCVLFKVNFSMTENFSLFNRFITDEKIKKSISVEVSEKYKQKVKIVELLKEDKSDFLRSGKVSLRAMVRFNGAVRTRNS